MLIAYDSKTGNVQRFIEGLGLSKGEAVRITPGLKVCEPFVLVTYTTGFGEMPLNTRNFLEDNHSHLKGVACSGNKIWGGTYGKSADTIAELYGAPVLLKFELSGMPNDMRCFIERVEKLNYETHRA